MPESDPNKHPSRRYRALKPSGYEPESYEEYYGADEQAELWDIMQGVRPEDRFSGEFGLLPYLGYYGSGDPDDPAYGVSSINKYDIKNPEDLSQSKLVGADWPPGKLRRVPESGPIGFYNPLDLPFEYTGIEDIQYLEGSEYPSPGPSGVSAFYPQADFLPLTPEEQSTRLYTRGSPFLSSEEMRTGKVDLGEGSPHEAYVGNKAFPGIAVHELMHRGFHTEAVKDFSKEFNLDNAVMANDFFISPRTGAMDSYFQHMLIDSRDWEDAVYDEAKDPAAITEPYRNVLETFQDQFLEWLTPEKQAKYGIDLPDIDKLGIMGLQAGGDPSLGSSYLLPDPVHLAAGGTGTNIFDNPAFTPTVKTAVPFFSITTQGYFDDIGGISKAQAYAMNKAIEEGLAALTEKNPNNWTQDDIDRFNLAVENNLLAVASQYPDDAALQKIATAIQQRRDREWTTLEQKWETWNDFVDNYEASDDLNADIQDVAEKAIEIFGYGTDEGKEAFLMAAAKYGVTNEQIAEAMGTTVDAILGNLPDFNPISYAKEAVSKVWDWIKDAQGKCLVGLDGTLNCNWQHAGGPPIGGTTSGAPVWKIPGTNTTVGVDLGNEIYNVIFGRLTCALHQQDCPKLQDLPSLIFGDILREIERLIRGGLEEKVREKILRAMMDQIDDTDGSFGLGLNLEKYCYNEDGSIHSQVLVGQSCPINTSEEPPEGTPITQDGPCKDADGNIRKDVDGNDLYPDINGVCPTTTTITEVVCYSDTDGSTVPALADGTCPMGSSTTAPGPETLCTQSGGTWENGACVCPAKSKLENGQCMADAINVDAQKDECEAAGNTWDDVQKKCYLADQTVTAAQTKCTESGGTWENGVCNCGNDPTIELVDGQCVVKDGSFRTPEEVCVTNRDGTATGNTWENGRCVGPATVDDRSDKQKCEDNGNTWNEATNTCITAGGVVNDDDAEEQCKTQGGNYYWNRNNQTCVNRCPGGGTYNADKDACETTVSDDDPDDPEYTTCSGITDYNQQPVNGVYPTVTRNYLAAEFAEIGGVCPAHFGPPPGGNGGDNGDGGDGTLEDCQQWSWDTKQFEVVPRDENGECPTGYGGTPPKDWSGTPCDIPNSQPTKEGGCECAPGYVATVSEDGTLTACVSDWKGKCEFDGAYWDDQSETCDCMGGYEPVYTDGVLTACTKKDPGCPTNGEINELGECVCKEGFTPGYTDGVLTSCTKGKDVGDDDNGNGENGDNGNGENGDACPANSTRNDDGVCVCNTGYSPSTDSDGVMTCSLDYPANNCSNPAYAATHVAECGSCEDKEYAEANPQICGITDGDPYTRPYATFEGVDMVRPPWVTPEDVRIDRYPETEPITYSTLPAPAGSYEYGISSLARRPQDIREAVSVIDPGYEQLRGGPPAFTTEEVSPEEQARRQAATDRYYGAMGRLSDYSTDFNIGVDELSESLGIPRTNFYEAPADGGFSIHDPNFTYATPTYGTPPEGYPTSPDILAAADRPFSSPWLEEEEEVEEESMFAHGGAVDEEPQGLESLLQRRQNAVNSMFVKRGRGNGVR